METQELLRLVANKTLLELRELDSEGEVQFTKHIPLMDHDLRCIGLANEREKTIRLCESPDAQPEDSKFLVFDDYFAQTPRSYLRRHKSTVQREIDYQVESILEQYHLKFLKIPKDSSSHPSIESNGGYTVDEHCLELEITSKETLASIIRQFENT